MTLTDLFTNIANAIRAKTGSTEPIIAEDFPSAIEAIEVGVSENLDEEIATQEEKIASQDELIASIAAALEGKAAGSGSGVDTCTVELIPPSNKTNLRYLAIYLNVLEDKKIVQIDLGGTTFENSNGITVENVICGTSILFNHWVSPNYNIFIDGEEPEDIIYDSIVNVCFIPYKNNGIVTIELQNV